MAGIEVVNVRSGIRLEKKKCRYMCMYAYIIYNAYTCMRIYLLTCFAQKIKYMIFLINSTKHPGGHGDEGEKNEEGLHVR